MDQIDLPPNLTINFVYRSQVTAQVWNITGTPAYETYSDAHYNAGQYNVLATDQGASGTYVATTPSGVLAVGAYSFQAWSHVGGTVSTDFKLGGGNSDSPGEETSQSQIAGIVSGSNKLVLSLSQDFNNIGQTTPYPFGGIFTPLVSTIARPLASQVNVAISQYSAPLIQWQITDSTGTAVDLTGSTVRFIAYSNDGVPSDNTMAFEYDNAAIGGLTISGTGNNYVNVQININGPVTNKACCLSYIVWLVQDLGPIPLAGGTFDIQPALYLSS